MTLNMEVKKDALRQTQDGIWKLTVTVHPSDMPVDLMMAPMGTRYGLAMVVIEDEQSANNAQSNCPEIPDSSVSKESLPTQIEKQPSINEKSEGKKLLARAHCICGEEGFYSFLLNDRPHATKGAYQSHEDWCVECLYARCNIKSRSELTTNPAAQEKFKQLDQKFKDWQFEQRNADNLSR